MRSTLYWLTSSAIAALSMHAMAGVGDQDPMVLGQIMADPSGVSEVSRSVLLGIGIMAVAYTYRQAWQNRGVR
ncbi:MAG: hypothetical protein NTV80_25040 [Verrucomicrobia bacterium]|nr:hypothetical protein [Verrucomicrobiota bacterium]